jgi:hypothetical protein
MSFLVLALAAHADPLVDFGSTPPPDPEPAPVPSVVNGDVVQGDDWADAVGIAFGNQVGCTGTLIAPDVVLTAGHCADGITHAVVGANDVDQGTWIRARRVIEYPRWQSTFDVALVLLERDVTDIEPRQLAVDCVLDEDLRDGAEVAVVGFGATDYAGNRATDLKHEGYTFVQDADCSQSQVEGMASGCNAAARPAGELGAGGNNVDSCFGDSGGPLYLLGRTGEYLVGVTSRSYAGAPYNAPCRYGGIYTRPDAVLDWIEAEAGPVALPVCNHRPAVDEARVQAPKGTAEVDLSFTDEDRAPDATWTLVDGPRHGTATVSREGVLRYTADPGYTGTDTVDVRVNDGGNPDWPRTGTPLAGDGTVTFEVGAAAADPRDERPADGGDDGAIDLAPNPGETAEYRALGCAHTAGPVGAAWLLAALAFRRRR